MKTFFLKSLTLYTETQLLLLVGDVAADCAHQRHGNGADDPRDGAHLGRRLCERASSDRCINRHPTTKTRTHSPLLSSYWLMWSLSPRGCPPTGMNIATYFWFLCVVIPKVAVTFAFVRFVRVVFANVD